MTLLLLFYVFFPSALASCEYTPVEPSGCPASDAAADALPLCHRLLFAAPAGTCRALGQVSGMHVPYAQSNCGSPDTGYTHVFAYTCQQTGKSSSPTMRPTQRSSHSSSGPYYDDEDSSDRDNSQAGLAGWLFLILCFICCCCLARPLKCKKRREEKAEAAGRAPAAGVAQRAQVAQRAHVLVNGVPVAQDKVQIIVDGVPMSFNTLEVRQQPAIIPICSPKCEESEVTAEKDPPSYEDVEAAARKRSPDTGSLEE